jgi:hypothetical protein
VAVVVVVGLVIGVGIGMVQRNGQDGASVAAQVANPTGSNGVPANGSTQSRATGGSTASGTIQSLDGQNLTLTTANGTGKVKLADGVKVYKTSTVAIDQLKVGDQVTVTGRSGSDNKVTADTIEAGAGSGLTAVAQPGAPSGTQSGTQPGAQSGTQGGQRSGGNNASQSQPQAQAPALGTPNAGSASGNQAAGAQGNPNGSTNGRQRISGTIAAVSSSEITIKATDGTSTTFAVGSSTVVNRVDEGSKDDLKVGVAVTATGTAGSDGVLNATIVRIGQAGPTQSGGPGQ